MDFITASFLVILCAVQIHHSICGPTRNGRWRVGPRLPDPLAGVECPRAPYPGEYCDKFSSGQIKRCSPCSIDQLRNPDIAFPEECANLPCPYRCPEHISDHKSPAPNDSCDLTTASLTTLDTEATTDLPTTHAYSHGVPTSASTQETSTTTSSFPSIRPTNTSDNSAMRLATILVPVIIVVCFMAFLAYRIKKRRCKRAVITSPSTEPMIATSEEIEMSPPQTPTGPVIIPRQTSIEITTEESDMFVKLDCSCGGGLIPVGSNGVTIPNLLPSTRYGIVIGTCNDNDFHIKHRDVTETLEENPDVCTGRCNFSLHDLKKHIENNSMDFKHLKALFGHITTTDDNTVLRAVSRVLGVAYLGDVDGLRLFEEILSLDSQLKGEENSCSVYSIQQALGADSQNVPVPDYVAGISRKISSLHEDCLRCRHLVCQVNRNSLETTV